MTSVKVPQPLSNMQKIVNEDGTPTEYFIRWTQNRQKGIEDTLSADWPSTRKVLGGVGLSPGGPLSSDVMLDLENTTVTPGAYTNTNLTVDPQGRITAAASGSGGGGGGGLVLLNNKDYTGLSTYSFTGLTGYSGYQMDIELILTGNIQAPIGITVNNYTGPQYNTQRVYWNHYGGGAAEDGERDAAQWGNFLCGMQGDGYAVGSPGDTGNQYVSTLSLKFDNPLSSTAYKTARWTASQPLSNSSFYYMAGHLDVHLAAPITSIQVSAPTVCKPGSSVRLYGIA